jgi:hypothetical protein
VVNGSGYEGAKTFGRRNFLGESLRKGNCFFLRLGNMFSGLYFLVWSCVDYCMGASIAGGFGLGVQESSQNPRAREPDRLFS